MTGLEDIHITTLLRSFQVQCPIVYGCTDIAGVGIEMDHLLRAEETGSYRRLQRRRVSLNEFLDMQPLIAALRNSVSFYDTILIW